MLGKIGRIVPREVGVFDMVGLRFFITVVVSIVCIEVIAVQPLAAQPKGKTPIIERSPLLKEPKTPEEAFAATLLMVDLARLDLAAKYLEQFDDANPDDALLIKLRDLHGTGEFLRLSQVKELQPRSTSILDRLNEAAKRQAENPEYIDSLIQRLMNEPKKRDLAIAELKNAGVRAVPEILKQMSRPELESQQDLFVITLRRMGDQVIPPMIGALDSPLERIREVAIDTLGWFNAKEAIPYLWFPAFDEGQSSGVRAMALRTLAKLVRGSTQRSRQLSSIEASNELRRLAKLLYRNPGILPLDEQGNVALWSWSDEGNTVAQTSLTPEIGALFLSTRFARQSLSLSPDQPDPQSQYLASLLGLELLRDGWEKPRLAPPGSAMYLALTTGEEAVAKVLAEALGAGQPSTSVASLEVLSQIGSREQLLSQAGLKSPVIAALNSPDPRVQFAAAVTVLKLDPKSGFKGSNRVVEILTRSMTDPGQSSAVVIDTDGTRANLVAGFLTDGGYEGIPKTTGREGFEQAATTAGIELIFVHVNCARWDLNQTLANLRADSRTAAIPIVIYGPEAMKSDKDRVLNRYAPATYITEASSSGDFLRQLVPFTASLKAAPLSPREREIQKNAAVYWMATIASGSLSRIFDISSAEKELGLAVEDPEVAVNSLVALSGIGSGTAQRRIADVALNPQVPEAIRQSAAIQLIYHIQNFRLLLDRDVLLSLHEGWQHAENPGVKSALAAVIGALRPNTTIVGERLQQFPVPPAN